jgi:hypothetical protein
MTSRTLLSSPISSSGMDSSSSSYLRLDQEYLNPCTDSLQLILGCVTRESGVPTGGWNPKVG